MQTSDTTASSVADRGRTDVRRTLTRVAWWSILLGLLVEALLLLIRLDILSQLQPLAEALGRVTWSLLVCMGLGVGKVLSDDKPFWVGMAGLVTAPLAFTAAQAVQRTVTEITTSIEAAPFTSTLIAVAALRGVEYLILGAILASLAQRKKKPGYYLAAGLVVGLVFGSILLLVTPAAIGSVAAGLAWVVNELLFPMGCAAVLYGAGAINKVVSPKL